MCNYSEALERVSAEDKIALAMEIDRRMTAADARIKPDATLVATSQERVTLRNTLGLDLSHQSSMIYAYASCLAKEGEQAATGFKLLWGYAMEEIRPWDVADGCVQDALTKLGAGRLSSGERPAVIRNNAMADVRAGTLCTLLHSRKTAAKAGVKTTGNAAGSGRVAPSNLYIAPGGKALEQLLADMGEGLLVTEVSGLHAGATPVSGDFALLARGFEVHDGKLARAVEQITVAGNFYRLLESVTAVGDDLLFEGQPIGSPSVAVRALSVAGE